MGFEMDNVYIRPFVWYFFFLFCLALCLSVSLFVYLFALAKRQRFKPAAEQNNVSQFPKRVYEFKAPSFIKLF